MSKTKNKLVSSKSIEKENKRPVHIYPDILRKNFLNGKLAILSDEYVSFYQNNKFSWSTCPNTGYKWKLKWHKLSNKERPINTDIKLMWELGRLQFLLPILLGSLSNNEQDTLDEITKSIVDFHNSNPIGLGVQWACNMDVAIRVSNLVLIHFILTRYSGDLKVDNLRSSIEFVLPFYATHIENHLEWNNGRRNNHYLCNLMGGLACNVLLHKLTNEKIYHNAIEKYRDRYLIELDFQFNEDGTNFECSTSYHRLVSEVCFVTNLFLYDYSSKCEKEKIIEKNQIALGFDQVITVDGRLPLIGDCDSGYIFDLFSRYFKNSSEDIVRDRSRGSLYIHELKSRSINEFTDEIINFKYDYTKFIVDNSILFSDDLLCKVDNNTHKIELSKSWDRYIFEDFGLYCFIQNDNKIFVKTNGKNNSGHKHFDFIKTEIFLDKKYVSKFQGTQTYNVSNKKRIELRNVKNLDSLTCRSDSSKFSPLVYSDKYKDRVEGSGGLIKFNCGEEYLEIHFNHDNVVFKYERSPFLRYDEYYLAYGSEACKINYE